MTLLELLTQLGIPLLLGFSGYFFGLRKNSVETKKLEIEADIEAIDLTERRVSSYKKQLFEMQEEIEGLRSQISELKDLIENLMLTQCSGDDCPTKKAYDKILAQKEARRNKRLTKS